MKRLSELAQVIRSKNSGPFEITFDVLFDDEATYRHVQDSGVLTPELICALYGMEQQDLVAFLFFDPALAFKFTFKRRGNQGGIGERDTFGAQQHAPLLGITIPAAPSAWANNFS